MRQTHQSHWERTTAFWRKHKGKDFSTVSNFCQSYRLRSKETLGNLMWHGSSKMAKDTIKIWAPETFMTNLFRHIKLVANTQACTSSIITDISWLALRLHSIMQKKCWLGEKEKFLQLCTIQTLNISMPFSIDTKRSSVLIEFSWDCLQRQTLHKSQPITGIRSITQQTYLFLKKFHKEFRMRWINSISQSISTTPGNSTLPPDGSVAIHHNRACR